MIPLPLLELNHIKKRYGDRTILDIDELLLHTGSAYVLTGMNGSGKTTLLRILAGLETAEIGAARLDGRPLSFSPYPLMLRQLIGYVHQHPLMLSGSVSHNIAYGLSHLPRTERHKLTEEAMHWAGVQHLAHHDARTLSGGEKQRVALARARVRTPRLLLLDEPTSNLDGEAREQVIALIPGLVSVGHSVLLVCHDREIINLPGMQRLKLRDGRLQPRQPLPAAQD